MCEISMKRVLLHAAKHVVKSAKHSCLVPCQRDKIERVSKQINMTSARKDDYGQENQ